MLYSEFKERENRFALSLKILLPLIFIIFFIILLFVKNLDLKPILKENIIPFLIIFFIYVYYILYQIYLGFKTSVLDNVTKAFTRDYILKYIDKNKNDKEFIIALLKIKNIEDINDRYGLKRTDRLLFLFVKELDNFLKNQGYKNIKIAHIVGGSFIFLIDEKEKKVKHLLNSFVKKIESEQISDIYLKADFSYIPSTLEDSAEDLLVSLFEQLKIDKKDSKRLKIKTGEFEKIVIELIENRSFEFKFQPVENIDNSKIEIYEVLIKLDSNEYGKISQKDFISIVNRVGYELIFDKIIIEEIFKIVLDYNIDKKISINISPFSLLNNSFLNNLKKLSIKNRINCKNIIFEISANSYINDIKKLNENINILRDFGFLVALDNFGSDNTSFKYIKKLSFDIIIYDIDYTKNYRDKKYIELIKAFSHLFNELNIKSVIKFIENEEQYQFFKKTGVDYIQGYLIGKPTKEMRA